MDYGIPEVKSVDLGNALSTAMQIKGMKNEQEYRNALLAKSEQDQKMEQVKFTAEAMTKALSQKDPESAQAVYKSYLPDSTEIPDFSFVGDEVTVDSPMGKIVGKRAAVNELYQGMQDNPGYFTKPENIQAAVPYLVKNGIKELTIKDRKTARAYDLINKKVIEGTPDQIESMRLESPNQFQTVDERTKSGIDNMTVEQLTARSLRGDKEAQAILDAMQKRELDIASAKGSIKINLNQPAEDTTSSLAESMAEGRLPPSQVSQRGATRAAVNAKVRSIYPKFDFGKAEANYAYMKNPSNLRSMGLVSAARPRVESLIGKVDGLQNLTKLPILDRPLNKIRREVGNAPIVDFESLRNAIIQEVNTALSGTSVASDYRIRLELENLGSDRTPKQLKTAINNLLEALDARTDASLSVPYPWEVVQGKKTMSQWKSEQGRAKGKSQGAGKLSGQRFQILEVK